MAAALAATMAVAEPKRKSWAASSRLPPKFARTSVSIRAVRYILSSRKRPPWMAPYHAAAAPQSSDTAIEKARITALRRAFLTAVAAFVIAASTRFAASPWATPVLPATTRAR